MRPHGIAVNRANALAKINLALHVVGHRQDGYHLLDTLVTFADIGDVLHFEESMDLTFSVEGPEAAGVPGNDSNLILRAAKALIDYTGHDALGMAIRLEKHLPVASGIGGGSANAAATLRALNINWHLNLDDSTLSRIGLTLGADVPMCLLGTALRARGIGELINTELVPATPIVLVNPRINVPTPDVFRRLNSKHNEPLDDGWASAVWPDGLRTMRNDLEEPALEIVPIIAECLATLGKSAGCQIARMSGSGATCFGLFKSQQHAVEAADRIKTKRPDWWVVSTQTIS